MSSRNRIAPFVALAALASPVCGPLGAQEGATELFVERVDVNIVNVEVWVTDSDGRRVSGLSQDDFQLFEDGRPVEITNFYTTSRARAPLAPDEAPAELPANQVLHLAVLVDNANSLAANRNRALEGLEPFFVDRARQGDRVMLMSVDQGVRVVEPFTRDGDRLRDGLTRLSKARSQKSIREAERNRRLRAMRSATDVRDAYNYVRAQVQQEEQELQEAAKSIERVVRSLAGLPGRKALLYLGDGLPKRPGEAMYSQLTAIYGPRIDAGAGLGSAVIDPFLETLQQDQTPLLDRIAREANANQVTMYTVDTRGSVGAASQSPAVGDVLASSPASVAAAESLNYQETFIDLSASTGGTAVLGTFNYDQAISRVADDFDTFYSLGFAAGQGGDGEFHKIEVRVVNQPNLKVRHRRGYVAKPAFDRVSDRTLSSVMLGFERNPLGVAIDFGPADKAGRKIYELPVLVRLPLRNVALLPTGERHEGRLRIFFAVKDEEGRISPVQDFEYPIEVPAAKLEEALAGTVGYTTTLKIRRGVPDVVVGVWDEISGTDSFVHKKVRVGTD